MKHFLKVSPAESECAEALDLAITVVGQAGDDQITKTLLNFLMGETDGQPKVW